MNKKTIITLSVDGMMCGGCKHIIEKKVQSLDGVFNARADYADKKVVIAFNADLIDVATLCAILSENGYTAVPAKPSLQNRPLRHSMLNVLRLALVATVMVGFSALFSYLGWLDVFYNFPIADRAVSLGALFTLGLFTSVHCVGMCGGINISVSVGSIMGTLWYNAGRIVSYTLIGALAGALGSVVAFSGTARGLIAIAGGFFMVVSGLNMLHLFPRLRTFAMHLPRFITVPLDALFTNDGTKKTMTRPLIAGLLNGLMPCGPLQALQLYALSSASALRGALSMFLFSSGTVPLMVALGFAGTLITRKTTRILMTASAVLVIFLGMELFKTGLSMSGF